MLTNSDGPSKYSSTGVEMGIVFYKYPELLNRYSTGIYPLINSPAKVVL